MRTDGRVIVGVLVRSMNSSLSLPSGSFLVSMDIGADLTGTGTIDTDGDFRADLAVTWMNVDCTSVAIPWEIRRLRERWRPHAGTAAAPAHSPAPGGGRSGGRMCR
jgi:hypothetical protein